MDNLEKIIQEIKETLKIQTDMIKEMRATIDRKDKLINSICENYLSFIDGISYLDLPDEIRSQMEAVKALLKQLKIYNTTEEHADEDLEINEVEDISELVNRAHERSEGMER